MNLKPIPIVEPTDAKLITFARELERELALPLIAALPTRADSAGTPRDSFALIFSGPILELRGDTRPVGETRGAPNVRVSVDFLREHRHSRGPRRQQPLLRAIGAAPRRVFDATLGFARDAYHLARLGYQVTGCEREAAIVALLRDGLRRGQGDPKLAEFLRSGQLVLGAGDAITEFAAFDRAPDTIYIDPMFPENPRDKSLPKKEIQCLRALVGPSHEAELEALVIAARGVARDRVVVKRPHSVAPLAGTRHRVETKLVCYDVFSPA